MGAVALIGVIAIVIGIFAITLLSNIGGGDTPAVILNKTTGYNSVPEECLVISHEGGDVLLRSQIAIRVNGLDRTSDFTNFSGGSWDRLNTGRSLYLPMTDIGEEISSIVVISTGNPERPSIIYMYGGESGGIIHIPPIARFTANPISGVSPLTVQFSDISLGSPTSWSWTFGDGGTSSAQNPSHIYTSPGVYSVTLDVSNLYGSRNTTQDITVNPSLVYANFSGTPRSGEMPLSVDFADLSTGNPDSWLWEFGDGNTSTEQNPSHIYVSDGLYDVALTVAKNSVSYPKIERTNYINVTPHPPVANFSAEPREGEWELLVNFTDLSTGNPTSWSWEFGDGATSSEQNPSHTYSEGIYTVSLTVTNEAGSDTEEKSDYVIVTGWYPEAGFKGEPKTGTAPLTVQFTDLSTQSALPIFTYSYSWDFDGDGITDSNEQNPVYTYDDPGSYTVSLTIEVYLLGFILVDTLYEEKADYIVVTPPPPDADFSANPLNGNAPLVVAFTDLSVGDPDVWLWDFGDGATSSEQNPSHTYTEIGSYTVNLTAESVYGSDTEEKVDYISVSGGRSDILLNTGRPSYFVDGGQLGFDVTGSWSYIESRNNRIDLPSGTNVRLVLEDDQPGSIDISSERITTLNLNSVDVYVNGARVLNNREISGIYISGYSGMSSTLTLVTPDPGSSVQTYLVVDGAVVIPWSPVQTPEIRVINIYPSSTGIIQLSDSGSSTYLRCSADSYELL